MEKINVLIVDDSAFMRKLITHFLQEDSRIHVVGTARNGLDALDKIKKLNPDVVTLDIEMPEMNGIEALQRIMNESPRPVVMLSSTTKEGAENTLLAIQNGAVDFIQKPSGPISIDLHIIKNEIVTKVLQAGRVNMALLKKPLKIQENNTSRNVEYSKIELDSNRSIKKIVCIGTSTGGPRALQQVLPRFPKNYPAPIVIVQHMPAGFTKSLATRLNSLCEITVKEAENGEVLKPGIAYIAPGGHHMKIKKIGTSLAVNIDESEIRNGHRPSVDVLFESISEIKGIQKISVIMTGMGTDGSYGLKKLKETGQAVAIAESQETSIVFGMPKSAIETHLVDKVEKLEDITDTIISLT
ncbi:chemotaxis response regulator protein-glutamate methylesterase [Fredinandcohnia sp. QZ13]|uniref:protein-glutamate methylesterase/protein-glutamine glutaminase n=1 Tax=Fredinandcohnia sp. QZ13 TaxID=3073144 RepID=UPI0028534296|nr:chemotaxis response regulator protein-glutamate methylesterase [Fredinandcohnia sp. QZ13]MDR4886479.1 chemotaxis response regulator protein-glutamate methylesterase [Fredinandcohnia sp. QZ13]